jgi:uncharacterized membrane protein required for colicin V production
MLLNTLKQFNWLDIFLLVLIFRICYIALKGGFTVELFKFLGSVVAIYVSMHYYVSLSDFLVQYLPIDKKTQLEFIYFIIFIILVFSAYMVFVLIRNAFNQLVKVEAVSTFNKWGGLILGAVRSILLSSLIVFSLAISNVSYLKDSVKHSYLGPRVFSFAPNTYFWIWNSVGSKFITFETQNDAVLKAQEEIISK